MEGFGSHGCHGYHGPFTNDFSAKRSKPQAQRHGGGDQAQCGLGCPESHGPMAHLDPFFCSMIYVCFFLVIFRSYVRFLLHATGPSISQYMKYINSYSIYFVLVLAMLCRIISMLGTTLLVIAVLFEGGEASKH